VGSSSSPGGTRTIDFTLGGPQARAEDEQAALLDGMLAAAEDEDEHRRESPAVHRVLDLKPSALAAKYGVDVTADGTAPL
jgi:hypothetical protein